MTAGAASAVGAASRRAGAGTTVLSLVPRLMAVLMLGGIELIQEGQPLQQQLRVVGERVAAEGDDVL